MAAVRRARERVALILAVSLSAATMLLAASNPTRDRAIALPLPTATPLAVIVDKDGFHPSSLHLIPGQTVTWTNGDKTQHTATAADGTWDTGPIDPGHSVTLQFIELGKWDYMCGFKPTLRAAIVVAVPTPAPRTPPPQPQTSAVATATPAPPPPAIPTPVSPTPAPAATATPEPGGGAPQPLEMPEAA